MRRRGGEVGVGDDGFGFFDGMFVDVLGFGIEWIIAEGKACAFSPAEHAGADAEGEGEAFDAAGACDDEVAELVEEDDEAEAEDDVDDAQNGGGDAGEGEGEEGQGEAVEEELGAAVVGVDSFGHIQHSEPFNRSIKEKI